MFYNTELQANNDELQDILAAVNALPEAGGEGDIVLPELTNPGTSAELLQGYQLIGQDGQVVDGRLPAVELAKPSIVVGVDGVITATVTQSRGVVEESTKEATQPLYTLPKSTYTPSTVDQEIYPGTFLTGIVTIKGDANLKAENIVSGVSLFGVEGTAQTGGGEVDTRFGRLANGTIVEINDDTLTSISRQYAFAYSDELKTVRLRNVTTAGQCAFRYCGKLESVDLSSLTGTLQSYFFQSCYALKTVNIPLITGTGSACFQHCESLEKIDLGNVSSVGENTFNGCTSLTTLIIRREGSKASTLSATGVFTYTPIADGTGYIYVPSDLVDTYKDATNWSTYADRIRAIEDYPEICGG